jgi:hypothetical protein
MKFVQIHSLQLVVDKIPDGGAQQRHQPKSAQRDQYISNSGLILQG